MDSSSSRESRNSTIRPYLAEPVKFYRRTTSLAKCHSASPASKRARRRALVNPDLERNSPMSQSGGLKRSLGLWAIVGLGLGYMTPTVLFDTFGIVTKQTHGVVPLAYLVALVVMMFTAVSSGRVTRAFPTAGASYTFAREAIHAKVGFLVGGAALLDYLLLPLVNAVIIRLYMVSLFPSVPGWIWVVVFVA